MKFLSLAVLATSVALYACSSDDSTSTTTQGDGGTDAITQQDAAPAKDAGMNTEEDAATDAGKDASQPTAVRCTKADFDANDHTGTNGVDISFPTGPSPAQYVNNCSRVKVGQSVGFSGAFASHPLQAFGGDTPSFIPASTSTGTSLNLTTTTAGVFGFQCEFHPGSMFGAVEVVP